MNSSSLFDACWRKLDAKDGQIRPLIRLDNLYLHVGHLPVKLYFSFIDGNENL